MQSELGVQRVRAEPWVLISKRRQANFNLRFSYVLSGTIDVFVSFIVRAQFSRNFINTR